MRDYSQQFNNFGNNKSQEFNTMPPLQMPERREELAALTGSIIPEVQGILRDLMTHQEAAAGHIASIHDKLEWANGQMVNISYQNETLSDSLSRGFLEQLSYGSIQSDGLGLLIGDVCEMRDNIIRSVNELNELPGLGDAVNEAGERDYAFAVAAGAAAASLAVAPVGIVAALLGATGLASSVAVGIAAPAVLTTLGAANSLSRAGAENSALHILKENLSSSRLVIDRINQASEQLAALSKRVEASSAWLAAEISRLEDENPES